MASSSGHSWLTADSTEPTQGFVPSPDYVLQCVEVHRVTLIFSVSRGLGRVLGHTFRATVSCLLDIVSSVSHQWLFKKKKMCYVAPKTASPDGDAASEDRTNREDVL